MIFPYSSHYLKISDILSKIALLRLSCDWFNWQGKAENPCGRIFRNFGGVEEGQWICENSKIFEFFFFNIFQESQKILENFTNTGLSFLLSSNGPMELPLRIIRDAIDELEDPNLAKNAKPIQERAQEFAALLDGKNLVFK